MLWFITVIIILLFSSCNGLFCSHVFVAPNDLVDKVTGNLKLL